MVAIFFTYWSINERNFLCRFELSTWLRFEWSSLISFSIWENRNGQKSNFLEKNYLWPYNIFPKNYKDGHCKCEGMEIIELYLKSFCLRDRGRLGNEGRPISLKIGTQSRHVDFCNMPKFQVQRLFLAEFWISAPQGSREADFQGNFGHFSISLLATYN